MSAAMPTPQIIAEASVTKLDARHRDAILVAGSHGGVIAGFLAARAGVRAVILNDAGVGRDQAGISSLPYLERIGMAAATVGHMSARIGEGADMLARGVITHANAIATRLGVRAGQRCADAAERLKAAPGATGAPPSYEEARFPIRETPGEPPVWGLDSVSLMEPADKARILIIGSHGGILGGKPETAMKHDAIAGVFNDAGVGADGAALTRLPPLDARGIAAVTVDCMTARIGDARSSWETGILTHANETAKKLGARAGMSTQDFVALVVVSRCRKS
jgi:hypothetical protein